MADGAATNIRDGLSNLLAMRSTFTAFQQSLERMGPVMSCGAPCRARIGSLSPVVSSE